MDPRQLFATNLTNTSNVTVNNDSVLYDDYQWGDMDPLEDLTSKMKVYVTPILVGLGVLGNSLSLIVFVATDLRKQNASVHLAALAISDTGYLICVFIVWLSWFNINMFHQMPWCPMTVYFTYVFGFLSVWIVVAFTVERFIVICFPLSSRKFLRTGNAKFVVIGLLVIGLMAYSFSTWTSGIVPYEHIYACTIYHKYIEFLAIVTYIDVAITLVVPSLAIVALNTAIIIAMYKIHRNFDALTASGGNYSSTRSNGKPSFISKPNEEEDDSANTSFTKPKPFLFARMKARIERSTSSRSGAVGNCSVHQKRQIKTTKFLLIISTTFVLLNLPSHALRLRLIILQIIQPSYQQSHTEVAVQQLVEFIYYMNFAINFFLYSMCAKNFRKELWALFTSIKGKFRRNGSTSTRGYSLTEVTNY